MAIGSSKIGVLGGKAIVPGGTQTFNSTSVFTSPVGVTKINVTGKGATGVGGAGGPGGSAGNAGGGGGGGGGGSSTLACYGWCQDCFDNPFYAEIGFSGSSPADFCNGKGKAGTGPGGGAGGPRGGNGSAGNAFAGPAGTTLHTASQRSEQSQHIGHQQKQPDGTAGRRSHR